MGGDEGGGMFRGGQNKTAPFGSGKDGFDFTAAAFALRRTGGAQWRVPYCAYQGAATS